MGSPEPPLHPPLSGEGNWLRKSKKEAHESSRPVLSQTASTPRWVETTGAPPRILTPEERARVSELQDMLIELFVEHTEAVAGRQEERVKATEAEIDSLLREKEEIEKWAVLGSA